MPVPLTPADLDALERAHLSTCASVNVWNHLRGPCDCAAPALLAEVRRLRADLVGRHRAALSLPPPGRETRCEAETPPCRYCALPLVPANRNLADGCPCNSPRGVNHGLVQREVCTCVQCDPEQTGASRFTPDLQPAAAEVCWCDTPLTPADLDALEAAKDWARDYEDVRGRLRVASTVREPDEYMRRLALAGSECITALLAEVRRLRAVEAETPAEKFAKYAEAHARAVGLALGADESAAVDVGSLAESVAFWKQNWAKRTRELEVLRAAVAQCPACGVAMRVSDAHTITVAALTPPPPSGEAPRIITTPTPDYVLNRPGGPNQSNEIAVVGGDPQPSAAEVCACGHTSHVGRCGVVLKHFSNEPWIPVCGCNTPPREGGKP